MHVPALSIAPYSFAQVQACTYMNVCNFPRIPDFLSKPVISNLGSMEKECIGTKQIRLFANRDFEVHILCDTQSLSGHSPEQPAVADPAQCMEWDDLWRSFQL